MSRRLRVLAVEDSKVMRTLLEGIVRGAPGLEWLPPARHGLEALRRIPREVPDVLLVDLELPLVDGLELIRRVMSDKPRPIIVLSAHFERDGTDRRFEALNLGAVEVLDKPDVGGPEDLERFRARLVRMIELAAKACLVRRRERRAPGAPRPPASPPAPVAARAPELVVLAASTGGPPVLYELLAACGARPEFGILLLQHTVPGYEAMLAKWLSEAGPTVEVAGPRTALEVGRVVLAPARQVRIEAGQLIEGEVGRGHLACPVFDPVLEGLAGWGGRVAAAVLTGMGSDGAAGLLALRRAGAKTFAQAPESCVVAAMPEAAIALGAAAEVADPPGLASWLRGLSGGAATSLQ